MVALHAITTCVPVEQVEVVPADRHFLDARRMVSGWAVVRLLEAKEGIMMMVATAILVLAALDLLVVEGLVGFGTEVEVEEGTMGEAVALMMVVVVVLHTRLDHRLL